MIKILKKIAEIEQRLSTIEKSLKGDTNQLDTDKDATSYKEVIDEWLNGTKQ